MRMRASTWRQLLTSHIRVDIGDVVFVTSVHGGDYGDGCSFECPQRKGDNNISS